MLLEGSTSRILWADTSVLAAAFTIAVPLIVAAPAAFMTVDMVASAVVVRTRAAEIVVVTVANFSASTVRTRFPTKAVTIALDEVTSTTLIL